MREFSLKSPFWLNVLGLVILLAGLAGAICIDSTPAAPVDATEYRVVGNHVYPIQRADAKQHVAELQVYGGNTAVIIATFDHKLRNMLRGRNLAYLLVISALLLSAICFLLAWRMQEERAST